MSSYSEIRRSPDIRRYGPYHQDITRHYLVGNNDAQALENTLWDSEAATGTGSEIPAKCRDIRRTENFLPGLTLLTAWFKTVRVPGVAKVVFLGRTTAEKRLTDENEEVIEGIDWDLTNASDMTEMYVWKLAEGSNVVPVPQCYIRIETAYETFNPPMILSMVGHTNSSPMTNLGVGAETLLVLPPNAWTLWREDELWYVNYLFAYDPKGHNSRCKSRLHMRKIIRMPVYDVEGNITDNPARFREMVVDIPDIGEGPTPLHERAPCPTTSLSDLDGYIEW